jgi:peptidylprolyl isomerase
MPQAQEGDKVRIHYTGKLTDGTVFDSSAGRDPLEFILGSGMVIPGFDDAVDGLEVGATITAIIPAEKAYGPRREEMIARVDRAQFGEEMELALGQKYVLPQPNGGQAVLVVVELNDTHVTLDGNHELAGKDLVFDIELVEIV